MPTPGTWLRQDHQQMPYYVLRPANYSEAASYPVILHLHQYQNHSGQPQQADPWYNSDQFRSAHPCIVIVPLCVIGNQASTPTFNWGGVDPNLQRPIVLALEILELVVTQYGCDRNRLYITGNSMGGLGTWGVLCNPSQRDRFAAAMPVSGSCYYNIGNEARIANELKDLPVWSCHGARDSQVSPAFDQAVMPLVVRANPTSRFANDPNGQHGTWDGFYPRADVWDWLFTQRKGTTPVPQPASADRTVVMAGSSDTIIDDASNVWTITADALVAVNGQTDTTTANVTKLAWITGRVWQCNAAGNWWSKVAPNARWIGGLSANPLNPPGTFTVSGGKIIDPTGQPFVAVGMNNRPSSTSNAEAILQAFPGLTLIRMPMESHQDPEKWNDFVSRMEDEGVVCLMEHHPWPMQPALSGAALLAEANAAAAWAKYYRDRPFVWIGSMNEPQSGQMTPEHVAVYNAVRAQDAAKVVVFVAGIGGGNPGQTGAKVLESNAYKSMHNVVWDLHFYGWAAKYSTDQGVVANALMGSVGAAAGINACKAVVSADGVMPVIIGEFGPSTSGSSTDQNAAQVIKAVFDAVATGRAEGFAGWSWAADKFNALQASGSLTSWGHSLAGAVKQVATPPTGPTGPAGPAGPTLAELIRQLDASVTALGVLAAQLAKLK